MIVTFVHFIFEQCNAFIFCVYHVITSFWATGLFLYRILCAIINGVIAALHYVPTCKNNMFACTFQALQIFVLELFKSFNGFREIAEPYHLLTCLAIIFIPRLREVVTVCFEIILWLCYAIFMKLFDLKLKRERRRPFETTFTRRMIESLKWSNLLKKFKKVFKSTPRQQKSKSDTNEKDSFKDPALTCLICYENPKCVLLLPCRHACLCVECTNNLLKWQSKRLCPLCRKTVKSSMQIYI